MRQQDTSVQAVASHRSNSGFTLIELLLSLVIIGIITAILIPNMLNSLDKSKQKRTMADIRGLTTSIETYSVDTGTYPTGTGINTLAVLVPEYSRELIQLDAWDHDLIYQGSTSYYSIGSPGKDGGNTLVLIGGGGATQNFDDDIIYAVGQFVQWPEGAQE